jgi:hypothetical protein
MQVSSSKRERALREGWHLDEMHDMGWMKNNKCRQKGMGGGSSPPRVRKEVRQGRRGEERREVYRLAGCLWKPL